jgi:hypothetical protein
VRHRAVCAARPFAGPGAPRGSLIDRTVLLCFRLLRNSAVSLRERSFARTRALIMPSDVTRRASGMQWEHSRIAKFMRRQAGEGTSHVLVGEQL